MLTRRLLLVAAMLVGCSDSAPQDLPPMRDAPRPAAPAGVPQGRGSAVEALPEGSWSLTRARDGVTLLARSAPRRAVLLELSELLDFDLVLAETGEPARSLSVELRGVSSADVVNAAVAGTPHSLHYGVDELGVTRLERVVVGRLPEVAAAAPAPTRAAPRRSDPAARRRVEPPTPEARQAARERYDDQQRAWVDDLADEDPSARLEAAEWLYPDDRGVALLDDLVRNDPDPRVRARAAATLGEARRDSEPAALNALLVALDDPEPEVVLAALAALELLGDETVTGEVVYLLDHPSAEVRARALETIAALE